MGAPIIQRAFSAGELAPAFHARADQALYTTGVRTCRNFLVSKEGGVTNRAGTRFIKACKTTSASVQLLRYVSETSGGSFLIEWGTNYVRFYKNGAALQVDPLDVDAWDVATPYVIGDLVIDAGTIYYAVADNVGSAPPSADWYAFTGNLFELPSAFGVDLPNWYQDGRVITLTHKLRAPYELIYQADTSWILRPIATGTVLAAPGGLSLTPGAAGALAYGYIVTALATDTYEEGAPSAQVINLACATPTAAAPNLVAWSAVAGAAGYNIYCDPYANGTYGFVGTTTGLTSFRDIGLAPDFALTPPVARVLFNAAGEYPHVATSYQQRRIFGHTVNHPDTCYGSRIGLRSNFGIATPLQDDDAIEFRLAGNNNNPVQHLLGLKSLIVLSGGGEWTTTGDGRPGSPLTPSDIVADQQTYVGAADVKPVAIGNAIVYVQARGAFVHDVKFDQQVEGLAGRDLTVYASHLFKGQTITRLDYQQNPDSIVWAVRADGTLLGLTYLPAQDGYGWHRHDTGAAGRFVDVCVVPEADGDVVYVIVRRTIGGVNKRYIEKLEDRLIVTFDTDCFFVDSGLSYSGAPVTSLAGLDHLEGQVLAVVGDGAVIYNGDPAGASAAAFTVTAGAIPALGAAYSNVHAGLPIRFADLELLDLDVQGSDVRGKKKRVGALTLLVDKSARTFSVGPDSAHLLPYRLKPYETAADEYTGQVEINLVSGYNDYGRVFIRHTDPLPLTVLGVIPNVNVGG